MTTPRRYDAWPPERCAFAGMLAGRGLAASEIAEHPRIDSSEAAVRKRLTRLGLMVADASADVIRLPAVARAVFEAAGKVRGMTADGLAREVLIVLGKDAGLLDNVLDDFVETPK